MNQNDADDHQIPEPNYTGTIEDLIMDVNVLNSEDSSDFDESEDNYTNNNPNFRNPPNFFQLGGRTKKKECNTTLIFNSYLNALQINGMVDNKEFLRTNGEKYRRKLGQINSVLEYFGVIKKEQNIVVLCSKSLLNPPIKLKNLEDEIKELENQIQNLKKQLSKANLEQDTDFFQFNFVKT